MHKAVEITGKVDMDPFCQICGAELYSNGTCPECSGGHNND